jgi:hypothetical protein
MIATDGTAPVAAQINLRLVTADGRSLTFFSQTGNLPDGGETIH